MERLYFTWPDGRFRYSCRGCGAYCKGHAIGLDVTGDQLVQLVARRPEIVPFLRRRGDAITAFNPRDPDGGGLPRYVERELAAYLRCGILAHGFTRVRCQACHDEIVVAFSCKRRGLCPSCTSRRHGVLASAHRWRARVVPIPPPIGDLASPPTAMTLARRLDGASLLRRVFAEEVTRCPRCGDHLRVLAFLTHPDVTARILEHLGIASAVPTLAPARAPPGEELELGFDDP